MASIERMEEIQAQRIARFADLGLIAESGRYAGSVQFSAVQAAKLLQLIDKLHRWAVAEQEARKAAMDLLEDERGNRPFLKEA